MSKTRLCDAVQTLEDILIEWGLLVHICRMAGFVPVPVEFVDEDGEDGSRFGTPNCAPLSADLRNQFDTIASIPAQNQAQTDCRRMTYLPVTRAVIGREEIPRSASKFGGRPFLRAGEEAGLSCSCGKEMSFLFQLSARTLPAELHSVFVPAGCAEETAMFQFWLCLDCLAANYNPEEGTYCCRWVDTSAASVVSAFIGQQIVRGGLEKRLIGWKKQRDLPCASEAEDVWDIEVPGDWEEEGYDEPYPLTISTEKLSGFPHWG